MFERKGISGIIFCLSLLLLSCNPFMRDPEPVVVETPQSIDNSLEKDTAFFIFHILKDKVVLEHGAKQIEVVI